MSHLKEYQEQFNSLEKIVIEVDSKLLKSSDPDNSFFFDNVNFFSKSFLVTICAYLESFIKDIAYGTIQEYDKKLEGLGIPSNLTTWYLELKNKKTIDDKKFKTNFKEFRFNIKKKDLDDYVSGNPYRTIKLFKYMGINLEKSDDFNNLKDKINSIIVKRNNILHHNDDASDITLLDILDYVNTVKQYMKIIDNEIEQTLKNYAYQES